MSERFPRGIAARYLGAEAVSLYGDWLTVIALVVVTYRISNNSAAAPAAYVLVRFAPRVLTPLFGGRLADKISPASIIEVGSVAQGLLSIGLIFAANAHNLALILVTVGCGQVVAGFVRPAIPTLVPRLVQSRHYGRVNSLSAALADSALFVAPAIGGILLNVAGYQLLFVLDAASFVACAMLIFTLRVGPRPPSTPAHLTETSVVRLMWNNPMLRSLSAVSVSNFAAVTSLQGVIAVAAAHSFGGDANAAWLYCGIGCGGLLVSLYFVGRPPDGATRNGVVTAALIELLALALITTVSSLWVAMLLLALSSGGGVVYQIRGTTAIQNQVDPEAIGRVNGAIFFMSYLGLLLGAIVALIAGPLIGWQETIRLATVVGLVIVAATVVLPARSLVDGAASRDKNTPASRNMGSAEN